MATPSDLKAFWDRTLEEAGRAPLDAELRKLEQAPPGAAAYELRFRGFEGAELEAFYLLPAGRPGPLPVMLNYHGYNSSKSEPAAYKPWLDLGIAVLAADVRGQAGRSKDVPRPGEEAVPPMVRGILDKERYYLRGVYADVLCALRFLRSRPEIDPRRIIANGESQGGGLALLTACLDTSIVLCGADNPSLMAFERKVDQGAQGSTDEIRAYMKAHPERRREALATLEYFDLENLLPWMRCPSFWSASDDDPICPLSSVESGFAKLGAEKQLKLYHAMGHGVHEEQLPAKLEWVKRHLF